jgi:hypothetical protein
MCVIFGLFVILLQIPNLRKILAMDPIDNYAFSDLMINYEGGYLRRGLLGEGLLFINRVLAVDLWSIGILFFSVAIVLAVVLYSLLMYLTQPPAVIVPILFLSPFLFPFYAYDHLTFFRKDLFLVIALLVCALWIYVLKHQRLSSQWQLPGNVFLGLLLFVLVAIIDFAVLFLPLVLFVFLWALPNIEKSRRIALGLIATVPSAVLGLITYVLDLMGYFTDCWNVAYERALAETAVSEGAFWAGYAGLAGHWHLIRDLNLAEPQVFFWISAILLGPTLLVVALYRLSRKVWLFFCLALTPTIGLFLTFDWGRWLSLVSFSVVIFGLVRTLDHKWWRLNNLALPSYPLLFLVTLLYVATWRVPHCCVDESFKLVLEPNLITTVQAVVTSIS